MRTDNRYIGLDRISDEKQREIIKRIIKKNSNQGEAREALPLTDAARVGYSDDCDNWVEYGFLKGKDYSDDEVREILDEAVRYNIYSPYDCTGKAFTLWIDWHRNPSGLISYVHHVGLDV